MMAHMQTPAGMGAQAGIMVDAGAQGVYIMDSAGALTEDDVRARVGAMLDAIGDRAEVGMHAHNNLSLAVANTVAAVEEGATLVDACLAGLGAGAGNCQTEALVAVLERLGYETGIDLWILQDTAEADVRPLMTRPPTIDRETLTLGYAGVPSLPPARAPGRGERRRRHEGHSGRARPAQGRRRPGGRHPRRRSRPPCRAGG